MRTTSPMAALWLVISALSCSSPTTSSASFLPQTLCMLGKAPLVIEGDLASVKHDQPIALGAVQRATEVELVVTRAHRGVVGSRLKVFGALRDLVDGTSPPGHGLFFLSNVNGTPYVVTGGQGFFWVEGKDGAEVWRNSLGYERGISRAELDAELAAALARSASDPCPAPPSNLDYVDSDAGPQHRDLDAGADGG